MSNKIDFKYRMLFKPSKNPFHLTNDNYYYAPLAASFFCNTGRKFTSYERCLVYMCEEYVKFVKDILKEAEADLEEAKKIHIKAKIAKENKKIEEENNKHEAWKAKMVLRGVIEE